MTAGKDTAKTMDVWISITGTQQAGEESDTIELTTAGRMEKTDDGWLLTYKESETTGMEGVLTSLHISDKGVMLERSGAMNSLLVLEKGKRHLCSYETGYGCLTMGVYTRELHNRLEKSGGELEFAYTLDINSDMTSSHNVRLTVRQTEAYPQ